MDDHELISAYIHGNEQAFEALLMRHKDKLFRFIYLKVRDRELAEDIFQEVFVKIINTMKLGNYNEEGKFLPWAMRIAHNLVIDHFRKANKVRLISESSSLKEDYSILNTLSCSAKNIQQQITSNELEVQMVGLIDHLPENQREILTMRIFKDMSFKEIADLENISINTALGRMRYALLNLRKLIDKHQLETSV